MGGRVEGKGAEGEGSDGGGGVLEGKPVGFGGGLSLQDLAGLGGGELGLPGQEVEAESFLAKGNALGKLAEALLESFLGLLKFSFLQILAGLLGEAGIGSGARCDAEQGEKGEKNPRHPRRLSQR